MFTRILWLLFYLLAVVNFALLLFTVVTSGLHDIKIARARKKLGNRIAYQPKVTIIVPAYNEHLVITRCLKSILALHYSNHNVIILNDGSKDNTSELARKFIEQHSLNWEVLDIYPNLGKGGALNYAINNRDMGEYINILDADCVMAPEGLRNVMNLLIDKKIKAVNANVRVHEEKSLLAYFQQIEYIVGYYHKRHNAYTNSEFIVGGQGATYHTATVRKVGGFKSDMQTEDIDLSLRIAALGNKQNRLAYSPDTLVFTEAVPTIRSLYRQRYRWKFGAQQAIFSNRHLLLSTNDKYSKLLTWFRLPQSVFGEIRLFFDLILLAFFVTIAIATNSLWIFFGAWFTVTAYTAFVIAADQHTELALKIRLIAINTLLYPLHMGMTLLNIVAAFQGIYNWKKLVGIEQASGSWVSPDRIGKAHISS